MIPFLIVSAIVSILGMIGERRKDDKQLFTYTFIASVIGAVILKVI